jgi:DNA-binding transcriptional MocR family regulator
MPDEGLQRSLRHLARTVPESRARYDEPQGFAPLRQHLARRALDRGIDVPADQIILTDSASQSLDLLCRFFLEPGDVVLVDDPCYFNFHALLRAHRVQVVGVPYTPEGVDLAALEVRLMQDRPRFYLTNSGPHNPTGGGLAAANAHRLLKLAELHDTLIVEDDAFADLERQLTPRLAGFDGLERVIQIGSFSKTVSAAIRCGFIAVRSDWVEPLVDLKLAIYLGNSRAAASVLHHLLTDGTYRRHLEALQARLATAMSQTSAKLTSLGLEPFTEPRRHVHLGAAAGWPGCGGRGAPRALARCDLRTRQRLQRVAFRCGIHALQYRTMWGPADFRSPGQYDGWLDEDGTRRAASLEPGRCLELSVVVQLALGALAPYMRVKQSQN